MIVLDGKKFENKEKTFDYLNQNIDFDYYVKNLDALYDNLSLFSYDIEIINYKDIVFNLGDYGKSLLQVFLDAAITSGFLLNFIDKNIKE